MRLQPLTNDPIVKIQILLGAIDHEFPKAKKSRKKKFIEYLEITHSEISMLKLDVYDIVKEKNMWESDFDLLKISLGHLVKKDIMINEQMQILDIGINEELEFFYKSLWHNLKNEKKSTSSNERQLNELRNYIENIYSATSNETKSKTKNEKTNWLELGLLFATGEIYTLLKKNNGNATKTAKELYGEKFKSYRPYISESVSRAKSTDKNIFAKKEKMQKIIDLCKIKGITVTSDFLQIFEGLE